MPAPEIQLTRGQITLTMSPVEKNGWEIRGQISQQAISADWILSVNIFRANLEIIAEDDRLATFTASSRIPFNEAPGESEAKAKMQILVDHVFDHLIPTP